MRNQRLIVLKFGGSILKSPDDVNLVVHEIYRWVRRGYRVVAVVSAFAGDTDQLFQEGAWYGSTTSPVATATLVSTGELRSSAHLALALDRAGVPNELMDAARIGLRTEGGGEDTSPIHLRVDRLRVALRSNPVVVLPGFLGRDPQGRTSLLGRGGSDYTAMFVAAQLRARCRLIKDVDGLFEWDPRGGLSCPGYFRQLSWEDALNLDESIVQHKAIRAAAERKQRFEVSSLYNYQSSHVKDGLRQVVSGSDACSPLKIAVVGAGTVGRGVIEFVEQMPEQFEIVGIGVCDPRRHTDLPAGLITNSLVDLNRRAFDILVDVSGATDVSLIWIERILRDGRSVVTADKFLVAAHGQHLTALARQHAASFTFAAAVGGSAPVLESIRHIRRRAKIMAISGILNGTSNFVLDRLHRGEDFATALAQAQSWGIAEADPSRDLSGADAAHKLAIAIQAASGKWLSPSQLPTEVLDEGIENRIQTLPPGIRLRQVAEATWANGQISAQVRLKTVTAGSLFGRCRENFNAVTIRTTDGRGHTVTGRGAGRWPTALAIIGDLLSLSILGRKSLPNSA